MPTIGLIVEDESDEVALSVLVRKCRNDVSLKTRKCRGTVLGKFRGLVTELYRRYTPEKTLIVCDADGKDPSHILRSFKDRGLDSFQFPVSLIVIVQELEAWLIADPDALQGITRVRKDFKHPEKVRDPKRELLRLLPTGMAYTPQTAARIAEAVNLNLLGERCPRFELFRKAINGK
jgi:Domain of unknown function (DUF4276)